MTEEAFATFVNIILPLPLRQLYTYRVPVDLVDKVEKGKRVAVQFGSKRLYAGIIHDIHHQPPPTYEAKYILDVLDEIALISAEMFSFWHWMADYYMCALGDVMQAALPSVLKPESATFVTLNPECDINDIELDDREYLIVEALTRESSLTLDDVMEIVQLKNVFPLLKSLYTKGVILMQETLQETYKPKFATCIQLTAAYEDETAMQALFNKLEKNEKQLNLLLAYMQLRHEFQDVERKTLLNRSGGSESSLKTLIKNGVFELYQIQVDRVGSPKHTVNETFELNQAQQKAYLELVEQFEHKHTVLLHGITSSGKTHVYVKLMETQLAEGKQVLLLLPEIALTSQIISRVRKYFGDAAIAFHSRFNSNERLELWQKVKTGEAKIIIGARSALFLPFTNLGLVIVDEEHEQSYKQQDPAPRYHARDAAIVLAKTWNARTVLGSATPSFESYYNVQKDRFGLVKLTTRHGDIELPKIETANIAEEKRVKTIRGSFTSVLYEAIETALNKNEQIILFQNRRGYAPILECELCHHVPKCKNCDISLTYHKYNDSLKCHYCGYSIPKMNACVACGSHEINLKGLGTEKIEDELTALFPTARVCRLDLDSTRSKNGHTEIIRSFEAYEADIMVGTQMLSKGLDFGAVSVVGVINADQLLYFPDFRAHERTYQLLTQVAGRAGRKNKQGRVIIQTSIPHHHVIQEVIHQQYEQLLANELTERQSHAYPPFSRIIHIRVRHKDYKIGSEAAFFLYQNMYKRIGAHIIGPETPHVGRIKNYYIKEMLVKLNRDTNQLQAIKKFIQQCVDQTLQNKSFKGTIIALDVDPN